jgi:hypothetical protein
VTGAAGSLAAAVATVVMATGCGGGGGGGGEGSEASPGRAPSSTPVDADVEPWCQQYGRFAVAAELVGVDAARPDAADALAAIRAEGGAPADDLAAATEEAEVLLLDRPAPAALRTALPALLGSGAGSLDPGPLAEVSSVVSASCGADASHVALLARLGAG